MKLSGIVIALAASAGAAGAAPSGNSAVERYPMCPEGYNTACCFTIAPFTHRCSRGKCDHGLKWSCLMGKPVNSMKECLEDKESGKTAFCKRPGYEYFPSALKWTGNSFSPMLEPSDYRQYIRPGMHKPWVPSQSEIRWEGSGDSSDLKKREPVESGDSFLE